MNKILTVLYHLTYRLSGLRIGRYEMPLALVGVYLKLDHKIQQEKSMADEKKREQIKKEWKVQYSRGYTYRYWCSRCKCTQGFVWNRFDDEKGCHIFRCPFEPDKEIELYP